MTTPLRLATRGSKLATAQASWCATRITDATGVPVELVTISSQGDKTSESLRTIGGTGVFATAIREAVLDGRADFAVHSAKDLPTAPFDGLHIAAVPPREDPRDALVARDGLTLHELPAGAKVGTGSPRRAGQLAALGTEIEVVDIRGNVDTRMSMVTDGTLDAVVLARAGLNRLGLEHAITETLDPLLMLPAAGQGFLAVECGTDDATTTDALKAIDDATARACLTAERQVLATLEMGCTAPVAALAECAEGDDGLELFVRAGVASVEQQDMLRRSMTGNPDMAEQVGRELATLLIEDGAADFALTAHEHPAGDR